MISLNWLYSPHALDGFDTFAIFGAGPSGREVAEFLAKNGKRAVCFFDNDTAKQRTLYEGFPVLSPHTIVEFPNVPVIIATGHFTEVFYQLRDLGVKSLFFGLKNDPRSYLADLDIDPKNINDAKVVFIYPDTKNPEDYLRAATKSFCTSFNAAALLSFAAPVFQQPRLERLFPNVEFLPVDVPALRERYDSLVFLQDYNDADIYWTPTNASFLDRRVYVWRKWGQLHCVNRLRDTSASPLLEEHLDLPLADVLQIIQDRIMTNTTYFGIQTHKNPMDFWVYQEIIFETKPDVIVEIGNKCGGSTLALAHLCDLLNKGRVIGIDISHSNVSSSVTAHPRITFIEGDACLSFDRIAKLISPQETVLVIEDSAHTYDNTLSVLRTFSTLIKPGDYFIVEDSICHHGLPGSVGQGPYEAIETFVNENAGFEIDRSRESFLITWNPKGFLRRRNSEYIGGYL